MSENLNYLKVKTTGSSYLGWRGELLAKLALAWIPDLTINKSFKDTYFDFYVETKEGNCFIVEIKAFSSLKMNSNNVDKVKELHWQTSESLIVHAHNIN